jgi:hypothetical protein
MSLPFRAIKHWQLQQILQLRNHLKGSIPDARRCGTRPGETAAVSPGRVPQARAARATAHRVRPSRALPDK